MTQQEAFLDIVSDDVKRVVPAAKFLSGVPESNAELLRLLTHERRLANVTAFSTRSRGMRSPQTGR